MGKDLIIVESPAKAKTLVKYLGKGYEVMASYGHVRDLVPKEGAVDTDGDFEMHYQVIERNQKHVDRIKKAVRSSDRSATSNVTTSVVTSRKATISTAPRKSARLSSLLASWSSQPSQQVKSKTATLGLSGSIPRYFIRSLPSG